MESAGKAGRGFDVFCRTVGWLFPLCCSYGTPAVSSSHVFSRERRRVAAAPLAAFMLVARAGARRRPRYRLVTAESFKTAVRSGWDLQGRPAPTRLFLSPLALAERAPSFSGPVTLVLREARLGRPQPGCVVGGSQRDRRRQRRLPPLLLHISQPHQLVQPIAQPRVHVASARRCGAAEGVEQQLRVGCTSRSDTLHKRSHD